MLEFPNSKVYENLSIYSPWSLTINNVFNFIKLNTPSNTKVLDLMCGTGYLLNKIKLERPDLLLYGIDNNKDFITYAKKKYQNIEFKLNDVFNINFKFNFDIIICTGGIHHLHYDKKLNFLNYIKSNLSKNGVAIIADPYISDYKNELERRISVTKLGYEYLLYSIKNNKEIEVLNECINIIKNDINKLEFKTSISKFIPIINKVFKEFEIQKSWPKNKSEFGDYYFICKK